MKKKKILLFITTIMVFAVAATVLVLHKPAKKTQNTDRQDNDHQALHNENTVDTKDSNTIIEFVNFDDEYREGNITADEYVKHRLEDDYQDSGQIQLINFIDDHIDELSDDTLLYYAEQMSIEHILGIDEEKPQKSASIADLFVTDVYAAEENTSDDAIKSFKIIASPNKRFMVWYTTEGEMACSDDFARNIADTLEKTSEQYDEMFDTSYCYESQIIKKSDLWDQIIDVVEANHYTEEDYLHTMQVYIGNNKEALATHFRMVDGLKERLINEIADMLEDKYTMMLPYILMDSHDIQQNPEYAIQIANHELFHHYQSQVLSKDFGKPISTDDYASESTANLASALVSQTTTDRGYLNAWAAFARHAPNYLTDDAAIEEHSKTKLAYALFPYLYHYSVNIPNGLDRIKNAMFNDSFFGSLWQNIPLEEINDLQEAYMMGLLTQNYDNMNLRFNPEEYEDIAYRKTYDLEHGSVNTSDDIDVTLNEIGAEYYKIIPNGEYRFQFEFIRENESVVAYLVGEKDGEFFELDAFDYGYDLNHTFQNEGTDYDTYYFMVGNSSMIHKHRYTLRFTKEKIDTEEETDTDETENGYKLFEQKLMDGEKITREDMPESGYITFRSTFNTDEYKDNVFITYYYSGDQITREVFTNCFADSATKEIIQGYINDVKNNPRMFKDNYIKKGRRLICEYTEEQIALEGETLDDLIAIMNHESLINDKEFEVIFTPGL